MNLFVIKFFKNKDPQINLYFKNTFPKKINKVKLYSPEYLAFSLLYQPR